MIDGWHGPGGLKRPVYGITELYSVETGTMAQLE